MRIPGADAEARNKVIEKMAKLSVSTNVHYMPLPMMTAYKSAGIENFPNTYDYYLYHKHRMNWLGYDVKYSMESEIGSRREFSSLKHKEDKFSNDLLMIYEACNETLKPGGKVVLVIGDGKVAGKIYDAKDNMIKICSQLGWRMIDYKCPNLDDTSRSFQKSYRTKGKKEHIMVFKKES